VEAMAASCDQIDGGYLSVYRAERLCKMLKWWRKLPRKKRPSPTPIVFNFSSAKIDPTTGYIVPQDTECNKKHRSDHLPFQECAMSSFREQSPPGIAALPSTQLPFPKNFPGTGTAGIGYIATAGRGDAATAGRHGGWYSKPAGSRSTRGAVGGARVHLQPGQQPPR